MRKRALVFIGSIRREPGRLQIAMGVPALLGLLVCCLTYWSSQSIKTSLISERYFLAAMKAEKEGDLKTAKLWLAKVLQLEPNDPATKFRMALMAMNEKNYSKMARLIGQLAPEDTANYPPAHLFVASELVRDKVATSTPEIQERVRWHLTAALKKSPGNKRALQMLAEFELLHQNLNDAIKYYSLLEPNDPAINLLLAQLHVAKGERANAELAAQRGLRHFKTLARQDITDIEARIEWARLEAFLENYDQAATLLGKVAAYQRVPESSKERLRRSLADIYFSWSESIGREEPESVDQRVKLLEMSLRFAPEDARPYESLTTLQTKRPEAKTKVENMLSNLTQNSEHNALIHLNLAIEAVRKGDLVLEREHLELALLAAPRLGVAANNLAWNLANTDPSQLDRALQLASQAVHDDPDRFEFRATRGRILAIADRTEEAISDLELAALRLNHRSDISTALSSLYQRTDQGTNRRNPLRIQLN